MPAVEYLDVPNEPGWYHVWNLFQPMDTEWMYCGHKYVWPQPDGTFRMHNGQFISPNWKYQFIPTPPAPPVQPK